MFLSAKVTNKEMHLQGSESSKFILNSRVFLSHADKSRDRRNIKMGKKEGPVIQENN